MLRSICGVSSRRASRHKGMDVTASTIPPACAHNYDNAYPRPATTPSRCEQDQHLPLWARPAPRCLAVRILLRTRTANSHLRLNELGRTVTRTLDIEPSIYLSNRQLRQPFEQRFASEHWGSQLGKVTEKLGKVRKFNGVRTLSLTLWPCSASDPTQLLNLPSFSPRWVYAYAAYIQIFFLV